MSDLAIGQGEQDDWDDQGRIFLVGNFFGTFLMGYFRREIFSEKGVMENVSWTNLEKTNGCRIGLEEEDKEKEKKKEESA